MNCQRNAVWSFKCPKKNGSRYHQPWHSTAYSFISAILLCNIMLDLPQFRLPDEPQIIILALCIG